MKKYAFISRHTPTESQIKLAEQKGIELVHVGDADAFRADPAEWAASIRGGELHCPYYGAVVVHPALALRLIGPLGSVAVFENAARAAEGEKPTFEPIALHIYEDHTMPCAGVAAQIKAEK